MAAVAAAHVLPGALEAAYGLLWTRRAGGAMTSQSPASAARVLRSGRVCGQSAVLVVRLARAAVRLLAGASAAAAAAAVSSAGAGGMAAAAAAALTSISTHLKRPFSLSLRRLRSIQPPRARTARRAASCSSRALRLRRRRSRFSRVAVRGMRSLTKPRTSHRRAGAMRRCGWRGAEAGRGRLARAARVLRSMRPSTGQTAGCCSRGSGGRACRRRQ